MLGDGTSTVRWEATIRMLQYSITGLANKDGLASVRDMALILHQRAGSKSLPYWSPTALPFPVDLLLDVQVFVRCEPGNYPRRIGPPVDKFVMLLTQVPVGLRRASKGLEWGIVLLVWRITVREGQALMHAEF
jgi:hypothetical protein